MKSYLFFFIAIPILSWIACIDLASAQKSQFFDSNWNQIFKTKNKKNAKFFRKVELTDEGVYQQSDFYVTRERDPAAVKYYSDEYLSIPVGKHISYYRNGKTKYEGGYRFGLKEGPWIYYWSNGRIREAGAFENDLKSGKWIRKQADGSLLDEEYYVQGVPVGTHREYYKNGELKAMLTYEDGVLHGLLESFYNNGVQARKEVYENGELKTMSCFNKNGQDTSYFPYFIPPVFSGCDDISMSPVEQQMCSTEKLNAFIQDKLEYPDAAQIYGKEGTARLCFTVTKTGKLKDPFFLEDISEEIAHSCLQLFRKFPDWIPGKKEGIAEDIHFEIPLTFQLN